MTDRTVTFVVALAVVLILLATPFATEAQQGERVPRVGVLGAQSPEVTAPIFAFRQRLHELGYVEGSNIAIEWRWAHGRAERFPDLAAELVRLKVDVIVATVNQAVRAAQTATRTIPIVMVWAADPLGDGFVASLARPEGNTTGLSGLAPELTAKELQLLKEGLPNVSRVAFLWNPGDTPRRDEMRETEAAARALRIQLQVVEVRSIGELEGAFAAMTRRHAGAALIQGGTLFFLHRARIAELAIKRRLPTMCRAREEMDAGCLMYYGVNTLAAPRRAADYVDKILKGAKPADLPVEQPTTFELGINMKTAKALGLTIPPSLLLRVDQVIE